MKQASKKVRRDQTHHDVGIDANDAEEVFRRDLALGEVADEDDRVEEGGGVAKGRGRCHLHGIEEEPVLRGGGSSSSGGHRVRHGVRVVVRRRMVRQGHVWVARVRAGTKRRRLEGPPGRQRRILRRQRLCKVAVWNEGRREGGGEGSE